MNKDDFAGIFIHKTAEVSPRAVIGEGTRIWQQAQLREGSRVGRHCIIGKGVYIDFNVVVGDNVKIQNGCQLFHGASIEDGVFLGPMVVLTNDKSPRAINLDGTLKTDQDWAVGRILIKRGASLGAGTVVLPNVTIGSFAMVGAGAVVSKDVPDHALVVGTPARLVGFVCFCGTKLTKGSTVRAEVRAFCDRCGAEVCVPVATWKKVK